MMRGTGRGANVLFGGAPAARPSPRPRYPALSGASTSAASGGNGTTTD